jgi:hypothetical protein
MILTNGAVFREGGNEPQMDENSYGLSAEFVYLLCDLLDSSMYIARGRLYKANLYY